MSVPGKLGRPERVSVAVVGADASATVRWYQQELADTGGVPLTGFKLYYYETAVPGTVTLAYNGENFPEVYEFAVAGLTTDTDYSFYVTALNPDEGDPSDALMMRVASLPDAPLTISLIAGSRTGTSIGLEWPAPVDNGGSPVISYTLAIFKDNEED
jgi:hypothetical protein